MMSPDVGGFRQFFQVSKHLGMELCEDSPLTTAVAETSSTWTETVEKVEGSEN